MAKAIVTKNGNIIIATSAKFDAVGCGRVGWFSKNGRFIRLTDQVEFEQMKEQLVGELKNARLDNGAYVVIGVEALCCFPDWGAWHFLGQTKDKSVRKFVRFRIASTGNPVPIHITITNGEKQECEDTTAGGQVQFSFSLQSELDFPNTVGYPTVCGRREVWQLRANVDYTKVYVAKTRRVSGWEGGREAFEKGCESFFISKWNKEDRDIYFTQKEKFPEAHAKKIQRAWKFGNWHRGSDLHQYWGDVKWLHENFPWVKRPASSYPKAKKFQQEAHRFLVATLNDAPAYLGVAQLNGGWENGYHLTTGTGDYGKLVLTLTGQQPAFCNGWCELKNAPGKTFHFFSHNVKEEKKIIGVVFQTHSSAFQSGRHDLVIVTREQSAWVDTVPEKYLTTVIVHPLATVGVPYEERPDGENDFFKFDCGYNTVSIKKRDGSVCTKEEAASVVLPKWIYKKFEDREAFEVRIPRVSEYGEDSIFVVPVELQAPDPGVYENFEDYKSAVSKLPWYPQGEAVTRWARAHKLSAKAELFEYKIFWSARRSAPSFYYTDGKIELCGILDTNKFFDICPPQRMTYAYPHFKVVFDTLGNVVSHESVGFVNG